MAMVPWSELNLGGGGNDSGLHISAQGVRFIRGDVFGAYVWGKDRRYHQLVTLKSMPSADLGLNPNVNTSDNQAWNGANGVMDLRGCPSSASCAYMYFNGYIYYSGNISTANPDSITWCNTGGFTQTTETSNNVVSLGDPAQFMDVDPANPAHVIVGTPSTGIFETFNGNVCSSGGTSTWRAISTSLIPLGTRTGNSSPVPGYAIAFDPTGGTQTCPGGSGTCSSKAYVFTASAGSNTGRVYATANAGATWTPTAGGPTTVQHLKVSAASAGGGHVWATDSAQNAWELSGSTWTQIASLNGRAGDIAINPLNGDQIITSGGFVSTNGSTAAPTFTGFKQSFTGAGDTPWQATANVSRLASPNAIEFDPLENGTLVATAAQGAWTTTFPSSDFTWSAQTAGIEGFVGSQIIVSAPETPSIGAGDESGCQYSIATASQTPSACFPLSRMLLLSYAHGMSMVPGQNFAVAKESLDYSGGFDGSGYSTDGFNSNYTPFNFWNVTVDGAALASNGASSCSGNNSGCVRVTVPSTAALKTFAPGDTLGAGSIMCVLSTLEYWAGSFGGEGRCYPVTVIDATHFDLSWPYYSLTQSTPGYSYLFWVPAPALDDWMGATTITNINNDNGVVQVTVVGSGYVGNNWPVCISGTSMAGATVVDGCWATEKANGNTFDLVGSVFAPGDAYKTGGVARIWAAPGGGVAASTTQAWSIYGADKTLPYCTVDKGAHWTQIKTSNNAELSSAGATVTATVPAGSTSVPVSSTGLSGAAFVQLASGRWFPISGTLSGTTFTLSSPVPPGDSIPTGATIYTADTGWAWASFLVNHTIVADAVTPGVFYGANYNAGLLKWTDCGAPTIIAPRAPGQTGWSAWMSYNADLRAVPGEAGHLFFTAGPMGSATHPTSTQLSRMCNAQGANPTWQRVPGMFEPQRFGFGKSAPGKAYPAEYVVGWYAPDDNINHAQYGIWRSVDDPNHGASGACSLTQTWTNIGTAAQNAPGGMPLGWFDGPIDISGDPFVYGPVYYAGNFGSFYGVFP